MDAGPFFVLGAWAPLPVPQDRCQSQKQCQPTPPYPKAPAEAPVWKAASKPVQVCRSSKTACMRGPGHDVPPPDPKAAIGRQPGEAKAGSSDEDATTGSGARGGLRRPVAMRRGHASTTQLSSSPSAATVELSTVAEVLRTAKVLLQPTHAIERQFYADCYRACQVTPTGRPTAPTSPSAPPPPPPPLPYLSCVPEVALRLSCLGHRVVLRRVTDTKQFWSKSMTNTFCYVVLPGTGIGYVLDPGFKEHFRAGCMSDRYRDIWECLPPLFVGPPAKLVQLVQALCAELGASFEAAGRQLPPWRAFSATINRWMSPAFRDLPVPPRRASVAGTDGAPGVGPGMIPAADAQAFLRACEELLAGTASARSPTAGPVIIGSQLDLGAAATGSVSLITPGRGGALCGGFAGAVQAASAHCGGSHDDDQRQGRRRSHAGGAEPPSGAAGRPRRTLTGFEPLAEAMQAAGICDATGADPSGAVPVTPHSTATINSDGATVAYLAPATEARVSAAVAVSSGATAARTSDAAAAASASRRARAPEGLLSRSLRPQAPLQHK